MPCMAETRAHLEGSGGDVALAVPAPDPAARRHTASQFRGKAEYAIDDKGRLTLPAPMRKALVDGGNIVVLDGRAVIFDELTYRDAVDLLQLQVREGDLTSTQVRSFLANTHAVSPDTQGRIVVPASVRVEAQLERDVLVTGAGSRIEILPLGDASLEASLSVDDEVVAALDRALF